MDRIDRAILWQLQGDGRLANTELADRVGLSPSPCLRRVRALEDARIITGYRAVVDPVAVNRGFQVLVHVTMTIGNRASDMTDFETRVAELDEIIECRRMFGDPDYLLWVAVADLATYEKLYMDKLVSLPGVARTSSQLTMRTIKSGGRIPV
ncbi:MAG TPA: Lrp/AsnC ligand binding domain-containing protein [Actinomycetes bacterium]|nr:Lrp/AsnC ligand binding domain-containing protein [Actinomycetes bacterium]